MTESNTHHAYLPYLENKRQTVFNYLNKNPLLTPTQLANLIGIPIAQRKKELAYIKVIKQDWKGNYEKQHGSNRSTPDDVHNAFYRGSLPSDVVGVILVRLRSLDCGFGSRDFIGGAWAKTKSKNGFYLFRCQLGRVRLFSSGTVELFVRKPASDGKAMQLFCDAFTKTGLVDSVKVIEKFQDGLMRRMHATFDAHQKLPYMKVTAFEESHGFSMTLGDRSHPSSVEFMFGYNKEVQSARQLVDDLNFFMKSAQDSNGSKIVKRLDHADEYSS
jgi:hypothetical protein